MYDPKPAMLPKNTRYASAPSGRGASTAVVSDPSSPRRADIASRIGLDASISIAVAMKGDFGSGSVLDHSDPTDQASDATRSAMGARGGTAASPARPAPRSRPTPAIPVTTPASTSGGGAGPRRAIQGRT